MADNPFDRTIINNLEKALSRDWNQAQSQIDRTLRFFAKGLLSNPSSGSVEDGFLQGGLRVVEDSPLGLSVIVKAGLGFQNDPTDIVSDIDGILELDDVESYKPLPLIADHTFSVPVAPVAPDTRIDIIEVRADRLRTNSLVRQYLDPSSGNFNPDNRPKTLEFSLDGKTGTVNAPSDSTAALSYKVGVAANPGVAPATTAGYLKLAEINVGSGAVLVANADIDDFRNTFDSSRLVHLQAMIGDSRGVQQFSLDSDLEGWSATGTGIGNPVEVNIGVTGIREGDLITGYSALVTGYAGADAITMRLLRDGVQVGSSDSRSSNGALSVSGEEIAVGGSSETYLLEFMYVDNANTSLTVEDFAITVARPRL